MCRSSSCRCTDRRTWWSGPSTSGLPTTWSNRSRRRSRPPGSERHCVGGAAPDVAEPFEPFRVGVLAIDYAQRRVRLAGRTVELTPTEYGLLYELSVHVGRVLTHDHLLQRVWGPARIGEPWLVREVVKPLRGKLGDTANQPTYIFTERRVGYPMSNEAGDHHA